MKGLASVTVYRCVDCESGLGIRPVGGARLLVVVCRRCKGRDKVDCDALNGHDEIRCTNPHPAHAGKECNALLARRVGKNQVMVKCWTCKEQRAFPPASELRRVSRSQKYLTSHPS